MSPNESRRLYTVVTVLCAIIFGAPLFSASAQQQATPEQQAILKSFGINSTLVDPGFIQQLSGGCDTNPYQALETQFKGGPGTGISPRADTAGGTSLSNGLAPGLACRILKFFQYAQTTKGCMFKISYGFRSNDEQASLCGPSGSGTGCIAPGKSCHQYGLAADITSTATCISWARQFLGTKNPGTPGAQQFKIHFPYAGDHLQCSENVVANCNPSSRCGDIPINPGAMGNYAQTTPQSPVQNAMSALQRFFTPPQPATNPATQALTQQPLNNSNPLSTTYTTPVNTNPVSNTLDTTTVTPGSSTSTSALDLINAIANPSSTPASTITPHSTSSVTSMSHTLIDPVSLQGTQQPQVITSTQGGSQNPTNTQTFTSTDLSQNSVPAYAHTSSTFQILENLKQTLLLILKWLTPFGGTPVKSVQTTATTANLE